METIFGFFGQVYNALRPFLIGFLITYILSFPADNVAVLIGDYLKLDTSNAKVNRKIEILSAIITYILLIVFVTFGLLMVIPQCLDSLTRIVTSMPDYVDRLHTMLLEIARSPLFERLGVDANEFDKEIASRIGGYFSSYTTTITEKLYSTVAEFGTLLMDLCIAVISGFLVLLNRKKATYLISLTIKYIFKVIHKEERGKSFIRTIDRHNIIFRQFVFGKIIDSSIIGVLTFIILSIFNLPYALFNATVVGVTNIIPVFGPIFGAVPGVLLLLVVDPVLALEYALIILCIQQFDGNILGPKLLGNTMNISAYWILFSVTVFGRLFGIVGMFFGVPLFTTIYMILLEKMEREVNGVTDELNIETSPDEKDK